MLPVRKTDRISLADVLPSCVSAVRGEANSLALPPVAQAVVVLVDGLGASVLRARQGHARRLATALTAASTIDSGFPTTTASALATLATGTLPGQHGMVGYAVLDVAHDRVVNQLSGWDDLMRPAEWQRQPTVFETAAAAGLRASVIAPERYRDSGLTAAVLRGSDFISANTVSDRFDRAREWLARAEPGILYLYVSELDAAAHAYGWQSEKWSALLEIVDAEVDSLVSVLRRGQGLLVTADHGIIDVASHQHVYYDRDPTLLDGVRHVGGEPRCLQLYFEPTISERDRGAIVGRWRESESERSWVVTRDEAIEAGWFGPVDAVVRPRIGDLLIAARKSLAYYDSTPESARSRAMIGQHGSWSTEEVRVPLLRFGAFERKNIERKN